MIIYYIINMQMSDVVPELARDLFGSVENEREREREPRAADVYRNILYEMDSNKGTMVEEGKQESRDDGGGDGDRRPLYTTARVRILYYVRRKMARNTPAIVITPLGRAAQYII